MGRGDSPSRNWNALQTALLLKVSALWMGSTVSQMDDAWEAQLSMRALCCCARFSGLLHLKTIDTISESLRRFGYMTARHCSGKQRRYG